MQVVFADILDGMILSILGQESITRTQFMEFTIIADFGGARENVINFKLSLMRMLTNGVAFRQRTPRKQPSGIAAIILAQKMRVLERACAAK